MWIVGYFIGLLLGKYFLADKMVGTGQGDFPGPAMASGAGPFWFGLTYTVGLMSLLFLARFIPRFLNTRIQHAFYKLRLPLLMLVLGWMVQWLFLVFTATPLLNHPGKDVGIRGTIVEEPRTRQEWASYQVSVEEYLLPGKGWQVAKGSVLVQVTKPGKPWEYGDVVEFAGKLDRPKAANNPGQFDYRRYLANRGIYLTLKAHPGQKGEGLSRQDGNLIKGAALAIRNKLAQTGTILFPGKEGQLLNGMVLGANGDLDPELRETFNITGLSHLLSVSGFHVALVAAIPVLLGRSRAWPARATFGVAMGTVLCYSLVSGLSPPVVRSAVMITLGLFAMLFKQKKHWPVILAVAAFLTTFPYPQVVTEPGYQLSFAATWAILALTPLLEKAFNSLPVTIVMPGPVKSLLAVPLAAQLGTWPLVAFHFNQVSLVSILANLLLVDLAGLILILGLIVDITGVFSLSVAGIFQLGLGILLKLFIWLAGFLAGLPGASFNTLSPPLYTLLAYFGGLWLISNGDRRGQVRRFWRTVLFRWPLLRPVFNPGIPGLVGLVVLAVLFWAWPGQNALQVTFLDVGEGDSIFVRTPGGHTMLVDTGRLQLDETGEVIYDAGAKVVLPFLRSQGVNSLDLLVLTHPHNDHIGGAGAILNHLKVGKILISPVRGGDKLYSQVLATAKTKKIPLEQGSGGQEIFLDPEIKLRIMSPWGQDQELKTGGPETLINNQSLVIKLTYGSHSFLFTGDLEQAGMEELLATDSPLQSTVLKIPHHGSRTGYYPEFYRQVRPKVAIVPVGPNFFGHPHTQVVNYFLGESIPLLRTDHWGAITFQSDGEKLVAGTYAQGSAELKEQIFLGKSKGTEQGIAQSGFE